MRPAFALLLGRAATGFLRFGAPQVAPVVARAVVFRSAGFLQRDGDRLPLVLDPASLAAAATLQLAMFELMHDPAGDPLLT